MHLVCLVAKKGSKIENLKSVHAMNAYCIVYHKDITFSNENGNPLY
jgi:hypothetical protein